jgi:hypothetical protein
LNLEIPESSLVSSDGTIKYRDRIHEKRVKTQSSWDAADEAATF